MVASRQIKTLLYYIFKVKKIDTHIFTFVSLIFITIAGVLSEHMDDSHFPLADLRYLSWMRHITLISPAFVSYVVSNDYIATQ